MKSSISLAPEVFDLGADSVRHAVGFRVHLQLLKVAGPSGVLDLQSGRNGGQPAVHGSWAQRRGRGRSRVRPGRTHMPERGVSLAPRDITRPGRVVDVKSFDVQADVPARAITRPGHVVPVQTGSASRR